MYNILAGLKDYFRRQEIVTDNVVFRLHYIFTTVLLIAFSLLVTASQYVGNPIQCINDNDVPIHVINTYCWISTTFTIPKSFMRTIGEDVPHPGKFIHLPSGEQFQIIIINQQVLVLGSMIARIGNTMLITSGSASSCFSRPFSAMFRGGCGTPGKVRDDNFLCYLIVLLIEYLSLEIGGLMQTIVLGLNSGLKSAEERAAKKRVLIDYLLIHFKQHSMYVLRYWLCEVMCLVNVIGQLYLMNRFTGGEFFSYGLRGELHYHDNESHLNLNVYILSSFGLCQQRPGATFGSYDLRVPSRHQVYIPQIRSFWNHQPARFHVRPLSKHHQREDVHFPLVLVHYHGNSAFNPRCLQVSI